MKNTSQYNGHGGGRTILEVGVAGAEVGVEEAK